MLHRRIETELAAVAEQGLTRRVTDLQFTDAVTARDRQGKKYLVFSSNNYLGLTFHPRVQQAAAAAAVTCGAGSTGARLTTGGVQEASDLERDLAAFKHGEAALLFNTGYMTNLGVLYGLARPGDIIFSDALNHASIIDGCRISKATVVVYRHNDPADLEAKLRAHPAAPGAVRFIVTDGVFSMDGDVCDLPSLVRLKEAYDCVLLVDDAHAVGVLGGDGAGTASYWNMPGTIDLQVGTLSKSLASVGGYVVARREVIEYLKNKSRPFIFSTFLSPADVAAAHAALHILRTEAEKLLGRLRRNTSLVRQGLSDAGIPVLPGETPIIPVMAGAAERATALDFRLREEGILLSAIRPPTVAAGASRLRLTVTAAHTEQQLAYVMDRLTAAWRQN
ncbi:MAG: aminotransferase class I/II-fold pyridoxal phosphate-dependent enzyme [Succiniclasticum sp.]|jgi:8-amino-7-oxononanoate synthase